MIEVLNLGAGVQSSTVLLMSINGELPKLDHAIFADTGWEPAAVYRQFDWLKGLAEAAGIKVHRVHLDEIGIKEAALQGQVRNSDCGKHGSRLASMPYFVLGPNGERGQIRRQCTYEYKIGPIEKCIRRDVLGLKPRQRAPKELTVRRWYGISYDEQQRMRDSEHPWAANWYPLVERRMSRTSCYDWLRTHGYPEAPRSACIGCPFRHNREWRDMKQNRPDEWQDAVEFDAAIRNYGGMRGQVFIHSDRKPLPECNLWRDYDENQLPLFDMVDECMGMCGV